MNDALGSHKPSRSLKAANVSPKPPHAPPQRNGSRATLNPVLRALKEGSQVDTKDPRPRFGYGSHETSTPGLHLVLLHEALKEPVQLGAQEAIVTLLCHHGSEAGLPLGLQAQAPWIR